MKAFGYRDNSGTYSEFGITCGVIFANSLEEATELMHDDDWKGKVVFEIPMTKGYHLIGEYSE